ncbi:hypothetical protein K7X08_035686 [Anisodus acutangulus]|uniref:Uncharacterized protein n=1 Tax=Anisodus acutangulus TaxID=402998 RepID=A0A9Q1RFT9_9SOLA|nr:hypothetical protein K7X08_035686 [Anisodus acutangulus]
MGGAAVDRKTSLEAPVPSSMGSCSFLKPLGIDSPIECDEGVARAFFPFSIVSRCMVELFHHPFPLFGKAVYSSIFLIQLVEALAPSGSGSPSVSTSLSPSTTAPRSKEVRAPGRADRILGCPGVPTAIGDSEESTSPGTLPFHQDADVIERKESNGTDGNKLKTNMAIHNSKEMEFALSIIEGLQEVPNRPIVSSKKGNQSAPYLKSVIE